MNFAINLLAMKEMFCPQSGMITGKIMNGCQPEAFIKQEGEEYSEANFGKIWGLYCL